MERIRVVFDDIAFELQNAGGVSKNWAKLIEYFSNNEGIYLHNIQGKRAKNNLFFPKDKKLNIELNDIIPLVIRRYLPVINVKKCDVFHSSYYRVPLFSKKIKQVVTVHDFMYELFDIGLKKKVHIWQKRKAMLRASAIICVSEYTKKDLIKLYPEIDKNILYVVPNGVDCEFKKLDTPQSNKKYILYVGQRVGCKNFKFVVKLFASSDYFVKNNFHLVCVGGGAFSKTELNEFSELGLEALITQKLLVNNNELNVLYNNAYALLFPSTYEGFGIPALEAQMAGCPVVYAITSSLPEVMGYSELGYELDDIPQALQKIDSLKDNELKQRIIMRGIKHASKFSWHNNAKQTYDIYKKILEQ